MSAPQSPVTPSADDLSQPLRAASLQEAVGRFFQKYGTFSGRASRSEYWYVFLVLTLISIALTVLEQAADAFAILNFVFILATVVPSLAIGSRRLHDIGKSGWWQLIYLIPCIVHHPDRLVRHAAEG